MPKIPIPLFDQRYIVLKVQPWKNYLISSTGHPSIHVIGRESIEHTNFPEGAVSGFTRAIQEINGFIVESAP